MKTQRVSTVNYSNNINNNKKSSKKDVTFGFQLVLENGASNPKISTKGSVLVHEYVKIFGQSTIKKFWKAPEKLFGLDGFLKDTAEPFKSNQDYIEKVAAAVDVEDFLKRRLRDVNAQLESNNLSVEEKGALNYKAEKLRGKLEKWRNLPAREKKLEVLALLLPGTIENNKAVYTPNIKRLKQSSEITPESPAKTVRLTDVNLIEVIDEVKKQGSIRVAKNVKFIAAKDLAATGVAVFEKFARMPAYKHYLKDGFCMTAIHPGGGYGDVDIDVRGKLVNIRTNEIGHDYKHNILTGKPERLGAMGASVPSLLNNYAQQIGITNKEDIDIIKKTGVGEMATSPHVRLNNKDCAKAIEILLQTGLYEQIGHGPDNTLLSIKNEAMETYNNATKYAANSFANNIAVASIPKIAKSNQLVVLSGPMTMGINESIINAPELYGAKDLRELAFKYIAENTKGDETIADNIGKFDIICDKRVSVKNNTPGGEKLLTRNRKVIIHPNRGQWLDLPLKDFAKKDKTVFDTIRILGKKALRRMKR